MLKIIILLLVIWIYRLVSNIYYFYKTTIYQEEYSKELQTGKSNILRDQQEIKRILEKAGIEDAMISVAEPIGYGLVQTRSSSAYNNMCYRHADVISAMTSAFEKALGVYRKRIIDNFNPIFWIETLIYLPKNIIKYIGLNETSIFTKTFQILYWLIIAFYTIYSDTINSLIQDFLSNLFK